MPTSSPHNSHPGREPGLAFRRRLRGESGAAIVEFALVLPWLCLMIVLILDFGRAFNYWIDTTHLATEGARLAAVDYKPTDGSTLQAYIRDKADTDELKNGGSRWIASPLEVCVNPAGDNVGDPIEVTATTTYKFLPIGNLPIPGLDDIADLDIHSSATMRREVVADNVSSGCG